MPPEARRPRPAPMPDKERAFAPEEIDKAAAHVLGSLGVRSALELTHGGPEEFAPDPELSYTLLRRVGNDGNKNKLLPQVGIATLSTFADRRVSDMISRRLNPLENQPTTVDEVKSAFSDAFETIEATIEYHVLSSERAAQNKGRASRGRKEEKEFLEPEDAHGSVMRVIEDGGVRTAVFATLGEGTATIVRDKQIVFHLASNPEDGRNVDSVTLAPNDRVVLTQRALRPTVTEYRKDLYSARSVATQRSTAELLTSSGIINIDDVLARDKSTGAVAVAEVGFDMQTVPDGEAVFEPQSYQKQYQEIAATLRSHRTDLISGIQIPDANGVMLRAKEVHGSTKHIVFERVIIPDPSRPGRTRITNPSLFTIEKNGAKTTSEFNDRKLGIPLADLEMHLAALDQIGEDEFNKKHAEDLAAQMRAGKPTIYAKTSEGRTAILQEPAYSTDLGDMVYTVTESSTDEEAKLIGRNIIKRTYKATASQILSNLIPPAEPPSIK